MFLNPSTINLYLVVKQGIINLCYLLAFLAIHLLFSSIAMATVKTEQVKQYKENMTKAGQGESQAMFKTARMLERGQGTTVNLKQAINWYKKAAKENYPAANARLGKLYLEGIGVEKNIRIAFDFLKLASIQGIPIAQFHLAIMYEKGVGTETNLQNAIKWYDSAAKNGYFLAKSKSAILRKQLGIRQVDREPLEEPSTEKVEITVISTTSIKQQNVKRTINTLIRGRWFDGKNPVGFLPSPKTHCNLENKNDIECKSDQLQRSTGSEIIFFKTQGTISNIKPDGSFSIAYRNRVMRVVNKNVINNDGLLYVSDIKKGLQKKTHRLNCRFKDAKRLICAKDNAVSYSFTNRVKQ